MRLTAPQIHAALGLAGMTQEALAQAIGMTYTGLLRSMGGHAVPRDSTLKKIRAVLEAQGVEFTEAEGVRRRARGIEVFEGSERFQEFTDLVYATLVRDGGDVCVSVEDESFFRRYRKDVEGWRRNMKALVDAGRVTVRILAAKSDFRMSFSQKRCLPAEAIAPTAFYAFGDCLALIDFTHETPPYVVLHRSGPLAASYRRAFEREWERAGEP